MTVSYTVTDDHGVEVFETTPELFDGLILRGVTAIEALSMIGKILLPNLEE